MTQTSFAFLKLDLRSLALFRFLLGIILLGDLISRIPLVSLFYSDSGRIPRSFLFDTSVNPYFFSIFNSVGHPAYVYALLALAAICYLCLTFGYKTRLFTLLSWIFFVSFSARAPMISHGGDDLIRLALFWMIFVPTNIFFSLDQALTHPHFCPIEKKSPPGNTADLQDLGILSCSTVALSGQLIAVYFFTALLKWHPIWTTEASAIYFSLQIDQYITPLVALLQKLPYTVTQVLTRVTLATELVVPFLVFIPFKNAFFRWVSISIFISFHFGLLLTLHLGTFPWICMAYWLIFIPASTWDYLKHRFKSLQKNTILYYDGNCGYCLKMISVFRTFLILPDLSVQKGQNVQSIYDMMIAKNSWILKTTNDELRTHYAVFIELISISPLFFLKPLIANHFAARIGNFIYKIQASDRKVSARLLSQLRPMVPSLEFKWVPNIFAQIFVLFCFLIAIYWSIALHSTEDRWKIVSPVDEIGSFLRLHQRWDMFAPYPWKDDGWIVVTAKLLNGNTWDILSDQPIDFSKPKNFSLVFTNTAVRKYLINLYNKDYSEYRLYFGRHLCATWNSAHQGDEKVDRFQVYYLLEQTPEPNFPAGAPAKAPEKIPEQRLLWDHYCFEKEKT